MGYNTPALLLNDAADQIARDRDIGEKIAQAMLMAGGFAPEVQRRGYIDVPAGNYANAVSVLKPQHGNEHSLLHLHGNLMTRHVSFFGGKWDDPEATLRAAAKTLGFKLVRLDHRKDR